MALLGLFRSLLLLLLLSLQLRPLHAQTFLFRATNLSTAWVNNDSLPHTAVRNDTGSGSSNIKARAVLLHSKPGGPSIACGFFCTAACDAFTFSVFIVHTDPAVAPPQVVWAANRARPVRENAVLQLTETGNLILRDADGTQVWSTNTSNEHGTGLNLTETGNLVLFDRANLSIWQSYDYPTDTLLFNQSLREGMRLTANVSAANNTPGPLYLTVFSGSLRAYVDSDPPQLYYLKALTSGTRAQSQYRPTYVTFLNGSLAIFGTSSIEPDDAIALPAAATAESVQFMRLDFDGHLRIYEWNDEEAKIADDVMDMDHCDYPTICSDYGIYSNGDQCSCPSTAYFKQVDNRLPDLGCALSTPLSCQSMQDHELLPLNNISYFNYLDLPTLQSTSEESCKQACLKNCSCRAALFKYGHNSYNGSCYLPSHLFSLQTLENVLHYNSSAYVKVQNIPKTPPSAPVESLAIRKKSSRKRTLLGSVLGVGFSVMFLAILILFAARKCKTEEEEEPIFHHVPGMPRIFSFKVLKEATDNFSQKLGEGGFGSVFEGKVDDEKVAVKRLDGIGQGKREFLAEVETIGSIHHINLVKLIGFCAEKTHRLLVYEYMCNGSLDKWIFYRDQVAPLDWKTRRKIILDIARGLSYLHEDCRQKIAHLDIKPQNILLDEKFNAKVSDFGLAKLIDRDQSKVMTRMRGTPGYLAPEWLTSIITEKVDIYSFGIVVTEIICGRKNLDHSLPEESIHLISLLQEKAKTDRLLDIVDVRMNDIQLHKVEIIEMMELAMWCLQCDSSRRPSMSTVVKVLEGAMGVERSLEYNFVATGTAIPSKDDCSSSSFVPVESLVSGPR